MAMANTTYFMLVSVAAFSGAVVSGLAGFAFSAVAGAILLHLMPPIEAVPLMMACSILVQVTSLPQNVFDKSDLIEPHPNHGVLLGQHGFFNPAHFDCREQHRRCRIQLCPVLLDEASRGRTNGDDQIGQSLRVERLEIFNKFDLSSVVAIHSRDEGMFLKFQRPRRLSVQLIADLPAPCDPRLEILAIRMKDHDFFRSDKLWVSGSLTN
jgi:hypothetical protein